jgi:TatD DNase family protein
MIDSHAHLTDERFADEVEAVVLRAREAGVEATVTVGTDLDDSAAALAIARRYADVFASVGIHPHASSTATDDALARVRDLAADPRVVAIGETGLDYHYDFSPRDAQRSAFERQLRLAADLSLPVIVHAREADADVQAMIREHGRDVRGVLHSFSSGADLLHAALELGWYASFAGMITFKSYADAELVRAVPADRLMVETDSPYLTPVPHRGKRNEPCRVVLVGAKAAELRGEGAGAFDALTTANARRFYALDSGRAS